MYSLYLQKRRRTTRQAISNGVYFNPQQNIKVCPENKEVKALW